jgi:hypothetical protein
MRSVRLLIVAAASIAAAGIALRAGAVEPVRNRRAASAQGLAKSVREAHAPWLTAVPANLSYTWKIVRHQDPDPAHVRADVLGERRAMIYYVRVQAPDRVRVDGVTGTGLLVAGGKAWTRNRIGEIRPAAAVDYPVYDYAHGVAFQSAFRALVEHTDAFDIATPANAPPGSIYLVMHPTPGDALGCFLWGASTGLFETHGGDLRHGVHTAQIMVDDMGRPVRETAYAKGHPAQAALILGDYRALPGQRWAPMSAEIVSFPPGDNRLSIRLEFQIVGDDVWLLSQGRYLRGAHVLDEVTVSDVSLEPIEPEAFAGPDALKSMR